MLRAGQPATYLLNSCQLWVVKLLSDPPVRPSTMVVSWITMLSPGLGVKARGISELLQFCVLHFGLLQDRNVGVSVSPKRKEILVGNLCLGLISRQSARSGQLQARQCTPGKVSYPPSVIDELLKFGRCRIPVAKHEISFSAQVDWEEVTVIPKFDRARHLQ